MWGWRWKHASVRCRTLVGAEQVLAAGLAPAAAYLLAAAWPRLVQYLRTHVKALLVASHACRGESQQGFLATTQQSTERT